MSMMDRILRLMAERKASDVYLSAHAPAIIKINGQYIPMNSQILPVEATVNLLSEVVPPNRIEELKETGELNMAIPLADVGNFRLSAMRQRGTYAAVIRFISPDIPELDSLNLPGILLGWQWNVTSPVPIGWSVGDGVPEGRQDLWSPQSLKRKP